MTKRSRKNRSRSKSRTVRRGQHGGNLAGNPPSAWGWGLGSLGNGWTQFMNSLSIQPGQNLGAIQSNNSVPIGNSNAQSYQGNIGTNMTGNIPQSGGKKRRRNKSSGKRGGNFLPVLEQAVVPGALFIMNNALGSRNNRRRRRR